VVNFLLLTLETISHLNFVYEVSGSSAKDIDPRIVQQVNMTSRTNHLPQDRNLGVHIDGTVTTVLDFKPPS